MAIKYELGLRTRKAYETGNKTELEKLARYDYVKVEKLIKIYGEAFEKQWLVDNKPHGFDIQHHRIGALIYRTSACRKRILDYTKGKINRIEELEEELLPYRNKEESTNINRAPMFATTNIIHQNSVPQ